MITLSPCIRTLGVLHTNPDTGVEYGIDYFAWVLSEPLTDNRNRLHTFFFITNLSLLPGKKTFSE